MTPDSFAIWGQALLNLLNEPLTWAVIIIVWTNRVEIFRLLGRKNGRKHTAPQWFIEWQADHDKIHGEISGKLDRLFKLMDEVRGRGKPDNGNRNRKTD